MIDRGVTLQSVAPLSFETRQTRLQKRPAAGCDHQPPAVFVHEVGAASSQSDILDECHERLQRPFGEPTVPY
jgi:hypothetical protein